jgi:hypothetical protein
LLLLRLERFHFSLHCGHLLSHLALHIEHLLLKFFDLLLSRHMRGLRVYSISEERYADHPSSILGNIPLSSLALLAKRKTGPSSVNAVLLPGKYLASFLHGFPRPG